MFKSYNVLFYLILMVSNSANAIVNIEKIIGHKDNSAFQGEFDVDLSGAAGNSSTQSTSTGSRFQWNGIATQFVVLKYYYAKSMGDVSTDKTFMHYRYISHSKSSQSWEMFFQFENNKLKFLKLRSLLGAGVWVRLLEVEQHHQAKLGLGLFSSREQFDDASQSIENLNRANIYFTYQYVLNKDVKFLSTTYYQPDIENTADYRALEQLSFEFKISANLHYFVTLDSSYDNRPFNSLKKYDSGYKSGIKYKF